MASAFAQIIAFRLELTVALMLLIGGAPGCAAQKCSQPSNPDFYDGYTVRKIELRHPFNFMFLVHHQLQKLKGALPLVENEPFSRLKFNQTSAMVDLSVNA